MYTHLTKQQRIEFSLLYRTGFSIRAAARILAVHHATLSRELRRNRSTRPRAGLLYHAADAHRQTTARRRAANQRFHKIVKGSPLALLIEQKLATLKWAPEQIAGWLQTHRPRLYVCAQTIYTWIHTERKDLRQYLHCLKRTLRRTRQAARREQKRATLAAVRHISRRPKTVERRIRYGHWEGDTVHGAGKSGYIATFVERKSGYLLAALLPKETFGAIGFADIAQQCFTQIPARYCKTLTLDNGPENKLPERIERNTGMKVYYATPYHSWERGTNENTNGLLRYFFPKKSSFAALTQEDIDTAVQLLNTRPRKRLNWRTPAQMLKV